ncbi:MAG: hypothetical protein ACI9V1_002169 [Spirosomataceae bacterium]|jgi:hypothetical protein
MSRGWETAIELIKTHKLVLFYKNKIEAID